MNKERRAFLKTKVLTAGLAGSVFALGLRPAREITLPFLSGPKTVLILENQTEFFPTAIAQSAGYYPSFNGMLPAYVNYNAALEQWRARMLAEQHMYYWMLKKEQERILSIMSSYNSYEWVGPPEVFNSVESAYGLARNGNSTVMYGMANDRGHVRIAKTLKGASGVWEKLGQEYDRDEQESAVGPQSSEVPAKITLPDGSWLAGNAYRTTNGALGVTDKTVSVDGKLGSLTKFTTGKDGNKYIVI